LGFDLRIYFGFWILTGRSPLSSRKTLTVHTDGGARGNPGPAAFAYVIETSDGEVIENAQCLGRMTNNQAEYLGLVHALEHCLRLGKDRAIRAYSDSELMVKQINGEYRVKNEDLRELYKKVMELSRQFAGFSITHVRRNENSHADSLYNEALDGKRSTAKSKAPAPEKNANADTWLKDQALLCLTEAAKHWAQGDATKPNPAEVLKKLQILLEAIEPRK
jgi:ribonuclease HI